MSEAISITVTDVEIFELTKRIASQVKANIVVGPQVKGKVTAHTVDTPWRSSLECIAKIHGCEVIETSAGVLRVIKKK